MQNVYQLRSQDQSKTVFVSRDDYKTTLDYQHKSGHDTSLQRDFMRVGFTSRKVSTVEACGKSCGVNRIETANWNTPILFGMEPEYYVDKVKSLQDVAYFALIIASKMQDLSVGIQPRFGDVVDVTDFATLISEAATASADALTSFEGKVAAQAA